MQTRAWMSAKTRSDLFDTSPEELTEAGIWLGPEAVFYLWMLAVFLNSLYSFWWDVTNDWGLSLLHPRSWKATPAFVASHLRRMSFISPRPPNDSVAVDFNSRSRYDQLHSRARSISAGSSAKLHDQYNAGSHLRSEPQQHMYAPPNHAILHSCSNPLLRSSLLLPDTIIYYSAIAIDLLLRFTWSLKLSSHLHAIHEIEQGVFLLELLEVIRRWIWVNIRVEWEVAKKGIHYDKVLEDVPLQEQEKL